MDNNWSELELRREALGRKNYLFAGSDLRLKRSAPRRRLHDLRRVSDAQSQPARRGDGRDQQVAGGLAARAAGRAAARRLGELVARRSGRRRRRRALNDAGFHSSTRGREDRLAGRRPVPMRAADGRRPASSSIFDPGERRKGATPHGDGRAVTPEGLTPRNQPGSSSQATAIGRPRTSCWRARSCRSDPSPGERLAPVAPGSRKRCVSLPAGRRNCLLGATPSRSP